METVGADPNPPLTTTGHSTPKEMTVDGLIVVIGKAAAIVGLGTLKAAGDGRHHPVAVAAVGVESLMMNLAIVTGTYLSRNTTASALPQISSKKT